MSESKTSGRSTSANKSEPDAIQLLTTEHKEVKALFKDYDKLAESGGGNQKKETLARQICLMLTVHATAEEEIFYPAARKAIKEVDLLDEAEVEHGSAKELIALIESSTPSEPLYDARVKVLAEYIDHHVKEEENELFPKVRKTKLDLAKLGEQISMRKAELVPEMAAPQAA